MPPRHASVGGFIAAGSQQFQLLQILISNPSLGRNCFCLPVHARLDSYLKQEMGQNSECCTAALRVPC